MEYLPYGRLLLPEITKEEQSNIRRLNEPYVLNEGRLKRVSMSVQVKTCISGDIIEEVICEAYEQRIHHPLQPTWHLVLATPYWWPTQRTDV